MKVTTRKSFMLVSRFIWHASAYLPQNAKLRSFVFSKKFVVHASFLGLMMSVAWHGQMAGSLGHNFLLYAIVSGEEVREGPIDPSAYAQANGVGGARLSSVDASESSIGLITFDDPEVSFSQGLTMGGNAVVAPLSPITHTSNQKEAEKSEDKKEPAKPEIYTVQSGDTIAGIAVKFGIDSDTILWTNGLSSNDVIKVGDHITILPTSGVMHTVKSGDTVLAIANSYSAKASDLVEFNGLQDSSKLSIGQKVIVPGGKVVAPRPVPKIASASTRTASSSDAGNGPTPLPASVSGGGFAWPTTTHNISQHFRWGHTGIDISNRSRPPVYAATSGTVEFAGWLGAYGNLIIINHGNGVQTYYAHLDKFYVGKGQSVGKGGAIGQMGSTGRSTGPHVHFEVRKNGRPINPMSMY